MEAARIPKVEMDGMRVGSTSFDLRSADPKYSEAELPNVTYRGRMEAEFSLPKPGISSRLHLRTPYPIRAAEGASPSTDGGMNPETFKFIYLPPPRIAAMQRHLHTSQPPHRTAQPPR